MTPSLFLGDMGTGDLRLAVCHVMEWNGALGTWEKLGAWEVGDNC